jgi:crotonobetainyl-CoA:carnitine CoA-transferase CaiB-like acyl-CoA transferase
MGAEVIKVEEPGGEPGRANGRQPDGFSAYFEAHNRGKKSLVLNMRKREARDIVRRLVPSCDVVVENYRTGVMDRWELGYEDLKALRPDIILASASAWGKNGPWAERPGFDHVAQALSGVMYEQGGGPDKEPHALIGGFADQIGAMLLAYGVASALYVREHTGQGQHVDVSLIGAMTSLQSMPLTRYLYTGEQPGFQFRRAATYTHYRCADGKYVAIAANTQDMWERFCDAACPALKTDPRFEEPFGRSNNKEELVKALEELFLQRPAQDWADLLTNADVPNAPVLVYAEVAEHLQFAANGYIQEIEHQNLGRMHVPGPPVGMSLTPPRIQGGGSELGQHTEEILLEAGYSWSEIEEFNRNGVT